MPATTRSQLLRKTPGADVAPPPPVRQPRRRIARVESSSSEESSSASDEGDYADPEHTDDESLADRRRGQAATATTTTTTTSRKAHSHGYAVDGSAGVASEDDVESEEDEDSIEDDDASSDEETMVVPVQQPVGPKRTEYAPNTKGTLYCSTCDKWRHREDFSPEQRGKEAKVRRCMGHLYWGDPAIVDASIVAHVQGSDDDTYEMRYGRWKSRQSNSEVKIRAAQALAPRPAGAATRTGASASNLAMVIDGGSASRTEGSAPMVATSSSPAARAKAPPLELKTRAAPTPATPPASKRARVEPPPLRRSAPATTSSSSQPAVPQQQHQQLQLMSPLTVLCMYQYIRNVMRRSHELKQQEALLVKLNSERMAMQTRVDTQRAALQLAQHDLKELAEFTGMHKMSDEQMMSTLRQGLTPQELQTMEGEGSAGDDGL